MSRPANPLGRQGEEIACAYLLRHGYRVLARNYRTRQAEVDIVAEEGGELVFVEVKTRRGRNCGHPLEAVTPAKCRHLSMAALHYLSQTGKHDQPARFDVVAVSLGDNGGHEVELVRNAFDLSYGT
ncbi:MAG: YraN family protein [Thermodesulfobacteriota bacterium]